MLKFNQDELQSFISEKVITPFYEIRTKGLSNLAFSDVLKRKNPYLFKAKNIQTAEEFVKYILDAFLSSQEETVFGNLMEELAIFACNKAFGGIKAEQGKFKSIDLIFTREGKTYLVGIKSGTAWGNKDQIDKLKSNFKEAKKLLKASGVETKIIAINGCIYGKDNKPYKKSYYKFCGQSFWELITGDLNFYQKIIVPIDKEAKKKDENFKKMYFAKINKLTKEFSENYLLNDGQINWEKIIDFISKR